MTPRHALDTDTDLEHVGDLVDLVAWLDRLRSRQPPPAPPERAEAVREAVRRLRLRSAGLLDADAIDALAPVTRPPVVLGHPGNRAAWEAVYRFATTLELRTLTLAGSTGTGKSWALAWLVADSDRALWLSPASIGVGARISGQLVSWESLRSRALYAPLLVLEDLRATARDWHAAAVAEILEHRHNQRLRSALATNLDDAALRRTYGDPLYDRLHDAKRSLYEARCVGESLRRMP